MPPFKEFRQINWDAQLEEEWRGLLVLAIREDLDRTYDWTTVALIGEDAAGSGAIVARQAGVVAGLPAARMALAEFDRRAHWTQRVEDGTRVEPGQPLAEVAGSARSLLTAERTMLNVLGHLSGIATLTRRYVEAVAGTGARIYDTRKTTPAWRRLEKYAVRAGGGWNHRSGLFDAVLIKDNHLAALATGSALPKTAPAEAVVRAREFLARFQKSAPSGGPAEKEGPIVEVEVQSLDELEAVLPCGPDIVLLDNMSIDELRQAVERRSAGYGDVQLEASGGVCLETVHQIARTGVDRISVGALTHSAPRFDVALEWLGPAGKAI